MVIVYKKKKYRAREQDATTVLKSKNCRTNVQPLQYTATHNYIYNFNLLHSALLLLPRPGLGVGPRLPYSLLPLIST